MPNGRASSSKPSCGAAVKSVQVGENTATFLRGIAILRPTPTSTRSVSHVKDTYASCGSFAFGNLAPGATRLPDGVCKAGIQTGCRPDQFGFQQHGSGLPPGLQREFHPDR